MTGTPASSSAAGAPYGKALAEIDNKSAARRTIPRACRRRIFKFAGAFACALPRDGLVYVCDRAGDRIQVFTKEGKYLKEFFIANETLARRARRVRSIFFFSFCRSGTEIHLRRRHREQCGVGAGARHREGRGRRSAITATKGGMFPLRPCGIHGFQGESLHGRSRFREKRVQKFTPQ